MSTQRTSELVKSNILPDGTVAFHLTKFQQNPSLEGHHFPRSLKFPAVEDIFDPIKGENRQIRLVYGERSIFSDEQSDLSKTRPVMYIEFIDGWLFVHPSEINLLKYLELSDFNKDKTTARHPNKNPKFVNYNPNKIAAERLDEQKLIQKAVMTVYEMKDVNEVIAFAKVMNVWNPNYGPDEARYYLSEWARRYPQKFLDGLKDPRMKIKYIILEAMNKGIISKNSAINALVWSGSNSTIVQAGLGQDPVETLVDFTFSQDGKNVLSRIQTLLYPDGEKLVKFSDVEKQQPAAKADGADGGDEDSKTIPIDTNVDLIDASTIPGKERLLEFAYQLGVVSNNGTDRIWFLYRGEKLKGWKGAMKTINEKNLWDTLKSDIKTVQSVTGVNL